jgi:hypothetical protein
MAKARKELNTESDRPKNAARRLRLPGFIIEEDIGLGDAVKRITTAVGIRPCRGCQERAAALNRWLVLARSRERR